MAASIEGARERLVFCHLLKIPAFDAMTDKPVIPNSLDIAAGLNNQDRRTRPVKQMKHACEVSQFNFNRKLCYRLVHLVEDKLFRQLYKSNVLVLEVCTGDIGYYD